MVDIGSLYVEKASRESGRSLHHNAWIT